MYRHSCNENFPALIANQACTHYKSNLNFSWIWRDHSKRSSCWTAPAEFSLMCLLQTAESLDVLIINIYIATRGSIAPVSLPDLGPGVSEFPWCRTWADVTVELVDGRHGREPAMLRYGFSRMLTSPAVKGSGVFGALSRGGAREKLLACPSLPSAAICHRLWQALRFLSIYLFIFREDGGRVTRQLIVSALLAHVNVNRYELVRKDPESALETRQETTSETSRKGREVSAARLFFFFPDFLYDTRSGITQRRSKAYRSCRSTPSRLCQGDAGYVMFGRKKREREKKEGA